MAVVIRLQRFGKRTQPHYRVVAIEKDRGTGGRPLEILGHYNPKAEKIKEKVQLKSDKLGRWMKNGAKPSPTVKGLISKLSKDQ